MKDRIYDAGALSDVDIKEFISRGSIKIEASGPEGYHFDQDQIQFGSIDLHFRHDCRRIKRMPDGIIGYDDIKNHTYTEEVPIENGELLIKPKDIIITTSQEVVRITSEFIGILSGRSSVARLGVMVQCCQELIQPGHGQTIPLQLINLGENTVRLPVNVAVCQLALIKLRTPSSGAYSTKEGAKYKDEVGPMDSRLYEEIDQVQVESTRGEKEIALAIEKTNEAKEEERKKKKRFWSSLICPVLASVIAALFSSALVVNTLNGKTVSGVLYRIGTFLGNIPLVVICIILLFVAYFFFTKWGTQ